MKLRKINIPKKHCESSRVKACQFFSWTGNSQESYCGLYARHTCNDEQYPNKRKPEFCTAVEVMVLEPVIRRHRG